MRCTRCGAELAPEDRFCGECGAPRPQLPTRFAEAEHRFAALRARYQAGELDDASYDAELQKLVVEDAAGGYWMLGADSGEWYWYDGEEWVRRNPPPAGEAVEPPEARPAPEPAVAPPTRKGLPRKWLAVGCAGLLVIAACVLAVPRLLSPVSTPLEPTAVTRAEVTATPTKAPTSTPRPTNTPRPTPSPSPQVGLLYSDDFSDPSSGWDVFSGENSETGYSDGEYYVLVKKPDWVAWGIPGRTFTDFWLEVDARKVTGPDYNEFGVIVRSRDDDNFYTFLISSDGYYRVRKQVNDEWESLVDWNTSPHINQGDTTNHFTLFAQGSDFSFYVNDYHLVDVTDASFAEGDIGLSAGTFDEAGVRIHFDNVEVWGLTSAPGVEPTPTEPAGVTPSPTPTASPTWTPTPVPPTPTPIPPTPTKEAPAFDPIIFAQGLTEEADPINPTTTFPPGTKEVYAVWACRAMSGGLELVSKWYHKGEEYGSGTFAWNKGERGRWWVSLYRKSGAPLPSGNYRLELYLEGQLLQSGTFVIE